jgi:DNA-binding NarL/FixJ family response regulator
MTIMKSINRILIVEDHTLLRQGLQAMLSMEPDLEVVGEAVDGRQGVHLAGSLAPRLVLMDLTMPGTNGTEAICEIKKRYPGIRVLVLTVHKAEEYIRAALQAGADGYVLKHASRDELMLAIRSILGGKTYLSPDVAEKVINGYLDGGVGVHPHTAWESLTLREREVLKLVAEGNANRHIADYLCVSVKTVEKHRSNLMKKLNLHNAAALTAYAIERGVVMS